MRAVGGLLILLGLMAVTSEADAGAWTLPKGQGQAILKYEDMRASRGFDHSGSQEDLLAARTDRTASLLVEYGLTDRVTLQGKGEWQEGRDAFVAFEGRGPIELGVRWQAYRDDKTVVAVYGGYAQGGAGRNAGYAPPGAGDSDWEGRLLLGRNLNNARTFVEAQVARRWRNGLPDEMRVDMTVGSKLGDNWLIMGQAFAGRTDDSGAGVGSQWLSLETSAVRHIGDWSVQVGWRQAVAGREAAVSHGPVVALWRRF